MTFVRLITISKIRANIKLGVYIWIFVKQTVAQEWCV